MSQKDIAIAQKKIGENSRRLVDNKAKDGFRYDAVFFVVSKHTHTDFKIDGVEGCGKRY